jgi:hypothetical protein
MKKEARYLYLGENGTIFSPVKLTEILCVKKYELIAQKYHKLTKDGVNLYDNVIVPESDLDLWYEVASSGQN